MSMRTSNWLYMFHQYERYASGEECEVPVKKLRYWANNTRKNVTSLTEEQKSELNGINFPWRIRSTKTERMQSLSNVSTLRKQESVLGAAIGCKPSLFDVSKQIVHNDHDIAIECKSSCFELSKVICEQKEQQITPALSIVSKFYDKEVVIIDDSNGTTSVSTTNRKSIDVVKGTTCCSSIVKSTTTTDISKAKQQVILIYPFVGGERIEKAAKDLKLSAYNERVLCLDQLTAQQVEASTGRAHILTITVEDRDKLNPGEFLNDTLIDFWMRW